MDGPAASGKGTLARRIAAHFNYAYLDTGSLYRALAYDVLRRGEAPEKGPCGSHSAIGRHGSIGPQGKTALLSEPNGPYCRDLD